MKKLSIIIATHNRPLLLKKLLDSIFTDKDVSNQIDVFVINDNSSDDYSLIKEEYKDKIKYHCNSQNLYKIESILSVKKEINSEYVLILDDDDFLSDNWATQLLSSLNGNLIILDRYNSKGLMIGNRILDSKTMSEFYFKKGKIGDKYWIMKLSLFKNVDIDFMKYKDMNEKVYSEILLYKNLYDLDIQYLDFKIFFTEYQNDGISSSILETKRNNPNVTADGISIILAKKPCLKIRIARLFEISLLNKHFKKVIVSKVNKTLLLLIKFFPVNYLLKKIYLSKLKSLTQAD